MPNDLALDRAGNLYVADSAANRVQVFDRDGVLVRSVESGGSARALAFPSAVAIAYPPAHPEGELYVADQRNGRVAVFDLAGRFRRALGNSASAFGSQWRGSFTRLQALAVDALGRVHALDSYQNLVQVLDGETGSFVESYGTFGSGPGELSVPLGIAILGDGRVMVTNSGNGRLELMRTLAPGQGG
jgi:DNA-binding beta-propeller fold protein YncE